MSDSSWKQVAVPLFLLAIMVLSVVGLSYSSSNNAQSTPTGSAPGPFTYNGFDFTYANVQGQQLLQTTVDGQTVQFYSRPQSVSRQGFPESLAAITDANTTVQVVAPATTTGANEQARFAAEQLASDITRRTPLTASYRTESEPTCGESPTIIVSDASVQGLLEETGEQCYSTSATDQSIFFISDYLAYKAYDIL